MKSLNYDARFVGLAEQINTSMPNYVVKKIGMALNSVKKAINGSTVVILGVAYKPNINDVRESPALAIISQLQRLGANVTYNDNYIPTIALSKNQSLHRFRYLIFLYLRLIAWLWSPTIVIATSPTWSPHPHCLWIPEMPPRALATPPLLNFNPREF